MRLLFVTLSLILGLYFLRNNIALSIIISLIYVVFIFLRFSKKYAFFIFLIFIGGAVLGNLNLEYNAIDNTYQGMVVDVKQNYFLFQSHFEKYYVYEENCDKEIGDFLTLHATPVEYKTTSYESRFDFGAYLKDKGVKRSLSLKGYEVDFYNPIRLRKKRSQFLGQFDEDARVLINAVLFNEKDYSSATLSAFNDLNLIYLVSISGIYLNVLFASLTYVFGLFTSEKVSQAVPILLLSPLAIFSFPRISILRIFITKTLSYTNTHFLKKRFSYLTLLSSVALFFVIIDFHLVYQEAFYIGFLLSLLVLLSRNALRIIPRSYKKIAPALLIYSFMLPVLCVREYKWHLFSFPFQLILIPFITFLVILSFIAFLNIPLHGFLNVYSTFLVGISKSLLKIDLSLPIMADEWFIFSYYVSLLFILYLLESQRIRHLRNVSLALASMFLFSLIPYKSVSNKVSFINVGQGDSILIQNRNKYVLIDTGGNISFDMAKECLIPYFNKMGVRHIDLLITTHDDYDHAGAAPSLMENFKVYKYLNSKEDFPYRVGDIYLENINFYEGDENDSSLVFKLDFMGKKWLFTGDASIESEKSIIASGVDIDVDILKVGHHGSATSSCDEFIRLTSPSEAIISCGAKNKYGHPSQEVIDRLNKYNVKIRRTDVEGSISYVSIFA